MKLFDGPKIPVPKITLDLVPRLMSRFASWDTDRDGTLDRRELDRAMIDPRVRGRDAAALAALRRAPLHEKQHDAREAERGAAQPAARARRVTSRGARRRVVENHAFTVIGFDEQRDRVTLRNPWGRGEPKAAGGGSRDVFDDGLFQMSIEELGERFRQICYEEAD